MRLMFVDKNEGRLFVNVIPMSFYTLKITSQQTKSQSSGLELLRVIPKTQY